MPKPEDKTSMLDFCKSASKSRRLYRQITSQGRPEWVADSLREADPSLSICQTAHQIPKLHF